MKFENVTKSSQFLQTTMATQHTAFDGYPLVNFAEICVMTNANSDKEQAKLCENSFVQLHTFVDRFVRKEKQRNERDLKEAIVMLQGLRHHRKEEDFCKEDNSTQGRVWDNERKLWKLKNGRYLIPSWLPEKKANSSAIMPDVTCHTQ